MREIAQEGPGWEKGGEGRREKEGGEAVQTPYGSLRCES